MVSLKWCFKQKDGIKIIECNENLARSYIKMAEDSLRTMNREKQFNIRFAISACYYSIYYSLYSVCMKIGIKCEIHSCTIELMKNFLHKYYTKEDIKIIKKAFDLRIIAQYYVDKIIDKADAEFIMKKASLFIEISKEILAKINENEILEIRSLIENAKN